MASGLGLTRLRGVMGFLWSVGERFGHRPKICLWTLSWLQLRFGLSLRIMLGLGLLGWEGEGGRGRLEGQ